MKHLATLLFIFFLWDGVNAQAGMWTWMKGDSTANSYGNYGTKGIPATTNEPAARYACAQWTDTAGNFWIYGGIHSRGNGSFALNDLWKFDPNTNMWTWMNGDSAHFSCCYGHVSPTKGLYDSLNNPGALGYGMLTWVTPDNHLWLFGSGGNTAFYYPLWQYDPARNQWAWMSKSWYWPRYGVKGVSDSLNCPGERYEGNSAWVDQNGDLWFFGGSSAHNGSGGVNCSMNDVWKYDINTGVWTWMSGSNVTNGPGVYGPQNIPSVNIYPSARSTNFFWKDNSGNFWLIGGTQIVGNNNYNYQDVWKFNPITLEWTWTDGPWGPDFSDQIGIACVEDSLNRAGDRYENRAVWKICDDLIFNFGGLESMLGSNAIQGLWGYRPSERRWIFINDGPASGSYGIKGVASVLNYPKKRYGAAGFKDKRNNIWLFGGSDFFRFNDLWKYTLDTSCLGADYCTRNCNLASPTVTTNQTTFCASDSAQVCAPSGFTSYLWNTGETTSCIKARLAGNYYVTVTDNTGCTAESNRIAITVYPLPPVAISVNGDTLSVYDAVTQQWYLNGSAISNATSNTYIATQGGSYTVAVTDTNGCVAVSSPVVITGIDDVSAADVVSVFPNPSSIGGWQLTVGDNLIDGVVEVFDNNGRVVFKSEIRNSKSEITADVAKGVYLLRISSNKSSVVRKLVRL